MCLARSLRISLTQDYVETPANIVNHLCTAASCPAGMTFQCATTSCPASCAVQDAPQTCTRPTIDDCACPSGQYLNNGQCTPTCPLGCVDSNKQFHPVSVYAFIGACETTIGPDLLLNKRCLKLEWIWKANVARSEAIVVEQ